MGNGSDLSTDLAEGQGFFKKISPDFELWDALNEGDKIPVVYLAENPEA